MKHRFFRAGLILLLLASAGAVMAMGIPGSGVLKEKEYNIKGFTGIEVGDAADVRVIQGRKYSVTITGDSNVVNHLEVDRKGDTLVIDIEKGYWFWDYDLDVDIVMPSLASLEAGGSAEVYAEGFDSGDDLEIHLSGSTNALFTDIHSGDTYMKLTGSSSAELTDCSFGLWDVYESGSSYIAGRNIRAEEGDFRLSGSSDIEADIDSLKALRADLSGSSNVTLYTRDRVEEAELKLSGSSYAGLERIQFGEAKIDFSGGSSASLGETGYFSGELTGASKLYYTGSYSGDVTLSGSSKIKQN